MLLKMEMSWSLQSFALTKRTFFRPLTASDKIPGGMVDKLTDSNEISVSFDFRQIIAKVGMKFVGFLGIKSMQKMLLDISMEFSLLMAFARICCGTCSVSASYIVRFFITGSSISAIFVKSRFIW